MIGGSLVDDATQIDGQRTADPGRHLGIQKNTMVETRSGTWQCDSVNHKTEQHSSEPLHSAPRLEKNRRRINKRCHRIGKQNRPSVKIVMQPACTRARVFRRISQASCRSDPRVPSRVCPGTRRTDPGSRRRGRWVTTGLANQLSVAQNVGKKSFRIHDVPFTKFKPLWDQLVTVIHDENTTHIQPDVVAWLFHKRHGDMKESRFQPTAQPGKHPHPHTHTHPRTRPHTHTRTGPRETHPKKGGRASSKRAGPARARSPEEESRHPEPMCSDNRCAGSHDRIAPQKGV